MREGENEYDTRSSGGGILQKDDDVRLLFSVISGGLTIMNILSNLCGLKVKVKRYSSSYTQLRATGSHLPYHTVLPAT